MSVYADKPVFICTGSDRRQLYTAKRLNNFAEVYTYNTDGCADGVANLDSLADLPRPADMLVLPMPCGNGLNIPCTHCANGQLSCTEFAACLNKNAVVTGGKMGTPMIEFFHSLGFDTADYFRREELIIKNCVPTAEGALALAMRETDTTVSGMRILICGWGHVAKACARLFSAVGARVCIAARNSGQLAEAESLGLETFELGQLFVRVGGFSLIINTVPALILTREVVCETKKDCLIIDLASKPGGTDFSACAELQRRAVHALSLPGKCAPITAGEIIADTVLNIYHERSGRNVT
jgi:dipicolinate synthase subunit A